MMRAAVGQALRWHRALMWFAAAMVVTALVSAIEYAADHRLLVGVPIWAKPLLFSISFVLYAVTLAWLISRLRRPRVARFARTAGTVIAVGCGVEMAAIVVQVLRGQQSHFNYSTPFNTAVFAGMGVAAGVIFAATIAVGVAFLRESPAAQRSITLAVRLGLTLSALGMAVGFLMVIPRASQRGALIRGAHSVGVTDGGPSLPLVGWSTTGGDLRIPHFLGLHALQALPLFALALTLMPVTARMSERARTRLVAVAAGGYLGLFTLALAQALRGQPLTHPDSWTLAGLAGLIAVTGLAVIVVVRVDRRHPAAVIRRPRRTFSPRDRHRPPSVDPTSGVARAGTRCRSHALASAETDLLRTR